MRELYEKMIDELCEKTAESSLMLAPSEPNSEERPVSPKDGKIVYSDGSEEVLCYGISEIKENKPEITPNSSRRSHCVQNTVEQRLTAAFRTE